MRKLPTGRQNFRAIREEDLVYVDKTKQIHHIIENGNLYFLSRPRRFGKSLLLSKFQHLFEGEKELFKGLYIHEQTDYDFEAYPVLHFNFSKLGKGSTTDLASGISFLLDEYATKYSIELPNGNIALQLDTLVKQIAKKGKPIVLLVDEYDSPITSFLTDLEKAEKNRDVLKDFFSPLKDLDAKGHLRFLFITGVSKFSKVSLFSDLNNLTDLSLHRWSDDLLGITQEELLAYFSAHIDDAAKTLKQDRTELLEGIKTWYNGYAYDPDIKLYNPFSLLSFFQAHQFNNFWFATGTPTFLVKSVRNQAIFPSELEKIVVSNTFFDKFSLEAIDAIGLLYQTGYLTIQAKETRGNRSKYFLGYPNEEVRLSMIHNLTEAFTYKNPSLVSNALLKMEEALEEGEIGRFVEQLSVLFSDISYHLLPKKKHDKRTEFEVWEGYFHTIIYLVTSFMGYHVQSEITRHKGRLDLLVETDDYLYLMEFKLNEPIKNAIEQIKNRAYAAAYKNSPKQVQLVGISFSKEERNVEDWSVEIWERG
ncbi:MAG: ATP-binding protein [Bacteroidota bacterium]